MQPSLTDSRNEFIGEHDNQEGQLKQFYSMMMTMMKNPTLMAKMMGEMGQENVEHANGNDQHEVQSKRQPIRNSNAKSGKGRDVVKQYQNTSRNNTHQINTIDKMADSVISDYQQHVIPPITNPYDQKPIKSNYTDKIAGSTDRRQQHPRPPIEQQLYRKAEERPICGNKKNFDELLNEELSKNGLPIVQPPPKQQRGRQQIRPIKTFLKKGTRQFLSSAKDGKSTIEQKSQIEEEKYERVRQVTPKNNRSISQNRVLNRKKDDQLAKKYQQKKEERKQEKKQEKDQLTKRHIPPVSKIKQTTPTKNYSPPIKNKSPKINKNKKALNVFQDSNSSENQHLQKIKGKQIIPGVYLTQDQIDQIIRKCSKSIKVEEQKLHQLRTKYSDLCQIVEMQKNQFKKQLEVEKQLFEQYKITQTAKIKNQRRVMERQLKTTTNPKQNKQQVQLLRKQLEKQREDNKKRDKNNKLLIQKYKKEIEELKAKLSQVDTISSSQIQKSNYQETKSNHQVKSSHQSKQTKEFIQQSNFTKNLNNLSNNKLPNSQKASLSNSHASNLAKSQLPQYQALKAKPKTYQYVDQDRNNKKGSVIDKFMSHKRDSIDSEGQGQNQVYQVNQADEQQELYPQNITLIQLAKLPLNIKKVDDSLIQNLFRYEYNPEYLKYLQKKNSKNRRVTNTTQNTYDGRTTYVYNDGGKQVLFNTGVRKQFFENGYMIIYFKNGDIKQKLTDGTTLYYYQANKVNQITLPNGTNIIRFDNGQCQFHYSDGRVQVRHHDGTIKVLLRS